MPTTTRPKLTPADHGREIDPDEFDAADGEEGYHYEIIDGRVYVSPVPNAPQDDLNTWLFVKLHDYSRAHPDVANHVSQKSRIFVPGRARRTCPEPDVAVYEDYPRTLPRSQRDWRNFSPILVAEVPSEDDSDKDLVRNVGLYLEVPSVREYWILDPELNPDAPALRVYRRRGKNWQKPIDVPFGGTYETPRVLPGFSLVVDPDR
jgi:Uma2 family endonuclease